MKNSSMGSRQSAVTSPKHFAFSVLHLAFRVQPSTFNFQLSITTANSFFVNNIIITNPQSDADILQMIDLQKQNLPPSLSPDV